MMIVFHCRFAELAVGESLRDGLRGKVVMEFPELHVVLRNSPLAAEYTAGEEGGKNREGAGLEEEGTATGLRMLASAYHSSGESTAET